MNAIGGGGVLRRGQVADSSRHCFSDLHAYGLSSPDNLASDVAGNVFIIEDQNQGDIWIANDADKDGVAESIAMFASLGDYGSEPTDFKVDPRDPFIPVPR